MKRSVDRILTTHVGSIVRPGEMLALANTRIGPPKDPAQYARVLQESVADVVKRQAAVGIDIVNDGEYGKSSWANYALERISGFESRPAVAVAREWLGRDRERFPEVIAEEFKDNNYTTQVCISALRYTGQAEVRRDAENLRAALSSVSVADGFLTAVAPASAVFNGKNEFYGNEREYIFALAEALREEYLAIYEAGLVLQVDDAVLANMYDYLVQKSPQHYLEWAELRVAALNHALRDIPEESIRYHVCFGSWHLPHMADAPLEEIVSVILQVKAGAYSLEAANPRHEHEWRVWQQVKLPPGRILIPGVITHHIMTVEHPRVVADRIVRFAQAVGRENVIASSDCGFAQTEHTQRVPPSVMWAKFESLVAGARLATAELWGKKI